MLLDKRNYAVLKRAMQSESIKEIFVNVYFALINQGNFTKTDNIKIACNHFKVVNGQLQIKGTVSAIIPLKKVQVFFNRKMVFEEDVLPFNNSNVHRQHNESYINYSIPMLNSGDTIVRINVIGEGLQYNYFFTKISNYTLNQYYKILFKKIAASNKKRASTVKLESSKFSVFVYNVKNLKVSQESLTSYTSQFEHQKNIKTYGLVTDESDQILIFTKVKEILKSIDSEYIIVISDNCKSAPYAVELINLAINSSSNKPDIIYSDDDQRMGEDQHINPYFKSDFNPDLLCSFNYIGENICIRTERLISQLNLMSPDEDLVYSLLLNQINYNTESVKHIPSVLFHYQGNTRHPYHSDSKPQRVSLNKYAQNHIPGAKIISGLSAYSFRLQRKIIDEKSLSIIIPFKDEVVLLRRCIESIFNNTVYKNYSIILVNNNSEQNETFKYLKEIETHEKIEIIIDYPHEFNYAKINNLAVSKSKSDYILFLNNDIEVINKGWLRSMVEHIQRPEVGAVGAKLLYPDNTIQHAGVIIGIFGVAAHAPKYDFSMEDKHFSRANTIQNLSACTAACLLVKINDFTMIGGFDELNFPINFNDVDLCLRLREKGKLIVYTPYAELYHYESKSRGHITFEKMNSDKTIIEISNFEKKWVTFLKRGDPYYNPHLSLTNRDYTLRK